MSKIAIHTPNGVEVRDMTAEEIAQSEQDAIKSEADKQAYEAEKAQKDADAQSGNQKLLDLGLTQAEATALTGYTPPVSE
jgi:hypothetical protein